MTTSTLRAVGGSIAVTLPRHLARQLGLDAGQEVEIRLADDGHSLTVAARRPRHTLAQMLRGMRAGDMPLDQGWDETPAAGREVW
jgi:antitoxin component of MazEF toxin-antitoxin module